MATVYMTVTGKSKDTTEAITNSAARLGVESSKIWISEYTPRFVDFPFTDPDITFNDHLEVVRQVEPALTVAPDIENGRDPSDVYAKADQLAEHADAVVIVPKDVHPSDVPARFRLGVALADYGSAAPWSLWDYRDAGPVHLLGGGPARQLRVRNYLPVGSVDTATLGKRCRFGIWDGKAKDAPDGWDFRMRLEDSLNNYAEAWV